MARTRMSWDWVDGYPVFVFTTFIDHFKFNVKVVKGLKGEANPQCYGPTAPAWFEYVSEGVNSKETVVALAMERAKLELQREAAGWK